MGLPPIYQTLRITPKEHGGRKGPAHAHTDLISALGLKFQNIASKPHTLLLATQGLVIHHTHPCRTQALQGPVHSHPDSHGVWTSWQPHSIIYTVPFSRGKAGRAGRGGEVMGALGAAAARTGIGGRRPCRALAVPHCLFAP